MKMRVTCVKCWDEHGEDGKKLIQVNGKPLMKDVHPGFAGHQVYEEFTVQTGIFRPHKSHADNNSAWSDHLRAEGALPQGDIVLQSVNKADVVFEIGKDYYLEISNVEAAA